MLGNKKLTDAEKEIIIEAALSIENGRQVLAQCMMAGVEAQIHKENNPTIYD